jgi:uncharacterized protein YndB with AHSA1/START domain
VSVAPIHREILVDAGPDTAFELFTRHIGAWWPLGDFSLFGPSASVSFEEGGLLMERGPDGVSACWGEVIKWDPPAAVSFTWHPGNPDFSSSVTVTFEARAEKTLVTLTHEGWEAFADPEAARAQYDKGWPVVLDHYAGHVSGPRP